VRSTVRSRCSAKASRLVDVLVRASVQLSPLCTQDTMTSHIGLPVATVTCKIFSRYFIVK